MSEMPQFGMPLVLVALILVPLLVWLAAAGRRRGMARLSRLVAPRLQQTLVGGSDPTRRRVKQGLFLAGVALLVIVCARPQWGFLSEKKATLGRDVIIAVDVSRSMLADDVKPDRLSRAKFAALDLVGALKGDRVGVIAFAGLAFLQAPLTIDSEAVNTTIQELDTDIIPEGGTNIARAIEEATKAFGKGESKNRALVILTDGEELDANGVEAAKATNGAIRIFTMGVGSDDGSLIRIPGEDGKAAFVKDAQGQFVKSRLDEVRLKEIAEATGGFYTRLQSGLADVVRVVEGGVARMELGESDEREGRRAIERFQWFLGAAMVLLVAGRLVGERTRRKVRRVSRVAVVGVVALIFCGTVRAEDPVELYKKGDYGTAAELFGKDADKHPDSAERQFNTGSAAFMAGRYDDAIKRFGGALLSKRPELREKSQLHLGNSIYKRVEGLKEVDEKLTHLRSALEQYEDVVKNKVTKKYTEAAKKNAETVQKYIEDLEKQKQEEEKQKKEQEQKQDKDKEDKQEKKDEGDGNKEDKKDGKEGEQDQKEQQQQGEPKKEDGAQDGKEGDPKQEDGAQDGKEGEPKKEDGAQDGKEGEPKQEDGAQNGKEGEPKKEDGAQDGEEGESKRGGGVQSPVEPKNLDGELQASGTSAASAEAGDQVLEQDVPGQMNERQARVLLESLKNEEERIDLKERKGKARVLRDW